MNAISRRGVMLAGVAASSMGCGYVLYPGRRGRSGGAVDIPVLIIDLLWLIPGLVPGAICLIVDFTTGCIYRGGRAERSPSAPKPTAVTQVDVVLDGEVVATGAVQPNQQVALTWSRLVDEASIRARARVTVRTTSGTSADALVSGLV